ncbi:MAG: hypothetical protein DRR08_13500 [Candidatus Parabeggiatoa sp. nov. 2]|nr:MAG: hypothetical protein B6247_06160 [Beggiatoa sp. 4572_84]RKZ59606.1 MAG: hypothetical protein DRR08_13500 [Gammaproteobacteria bacterium]HEC84965.1 hypothetical protein [Thioploca sp.]
MIRVIFLLILLAGLTGLLTNQQIQIPKARQTTEASDDTWKLPKESIAPNPSRLHVKLRQLSPWETDNQTTTSKSSSSPRKQKTKWKFVGIVQKGRQRYVMLLENNKVTQYGLKSSLPGGAYLRRINDDSIEVIQDNGEVEVIHLYR